MQYSEIEMHFVTFYKRNYSRSGNLLTGLTQMGVNTNFTEIRGGIRLKMKEIFTLVSTSSQTSIFVVMSPSHVLTLYLKFAGANFIILDAGWSLTEAEISRGAVKRIPQILKAIIVDSMSFMCADLILVESTQQKKFLSKKFFLKENKMIVSLTGANESELRIRPEEPRELAGLPPEKGIVLFRGKINHEAGIRNVIRIGISLEAHGYILVLATPNLDSSIEIPPKIITIERWIPQPEINYLYQKSTLVIGQLGSISRLNRTIPHKYFEAMFFQKPYYSTLTKSLEEVSKGGNGIIEPDFQIVHGTQNHLTSFIEDNLLLEVKGIEAGNIWKSETNSKQIAHKLLEEETIKKIIHRK
jgi:hypothetical protein